MASGKKGAAHGKKAEGTAAGKAQETAAGLPEGQVVRMMDVLEDLKKRLNRIDRWRSEIERERPKAVSAEEARAMLEKLEIPELKMIEARKKR